MSNATEMFASHEKTLREAIEATHTREYYSAFNESPSPRVYGENAADEGKAAFEAHAGTTFPVDTPGASGTVATEKSPYGFALDVSYPRVSPQGVDALLAASAAGMKAFRDAGPDARLGVCLEVLHRLHARVFELANAVQHTSGQAFVMAFQAGGAHALDRALEALAYAYEEMTRTPATAIWEKPAKGEPLRMEKTFTAVPRGVALVIGCNTFPTWNSWPGLFASLACGNPVVVKPHPGAVLPLAMTVQVCQQVLAEAGYDPALVTLAAEDPADGLAAVLAVRPEVKLIDFTGGNAFGDWLEENARQATVFTEKAGVNTVVVDSTDSFKGLCMNLAFSFSLYTGQMCTAPQNVYLPADGIESDEGHKSVEEVAAGIGAAFDKLLGDDARAVELLGGVVNEGVLSRLDESGSKGRVLVASRTVRHPAYDGADRPHADAGRAVRRRRRGLRAGVLRPGGLPDRDVGHGGVGRPVPPDRARARRDDGVGVLVLARGARVDARRGPRRRRGAVGEPHRRRVREPVGGVQRLPRHRCQPGGERLLHRHRLRREPVPHRPVPPPRLKSGQRRRATRVPRIPAAQATAAPTATVSIDCSSPAVTVSKYARPAGSGTTAGRLSR